jgi:osmoprotectant transport system substrate-binding protein
VRFVPFPSSAKLRRNAHSQEVNSRISHACAIILALTTSLVMAACSSEAGSAAERHPELEEGKPQIVVGSFAFSESRILAEIYAAALKREGFPVKVVSDVASREIMEPALEQDQVDFVPEYQGTSLTFLTLSRQQAPSRPSEAHARLRKAFEPRGVTVLDYSRAQNKNEIVVTRETALNYKLDAISDLEPVASDLVFGGPPECPARPLCLQGLERTYDIRFESFVPLDAGGPLTVAALTGGEIDVALLFSTHPAIVVNDLVVLRDDRLLQPAENVVPVVRDEIVRAYGSRFIHVVDSVTRRLTTRTLSELNREVEAEGADPVRVASEWLAEAGRSK